MGFKTYACPKCHERVYYPLRPDRYVLYVAAICLGVFLIGAHRGALGWAYTAANIVAGLVLIRQNARITKRVQDAKKRASEREALSAPTD